MTSVDMENKSENIIVTEGESLQMFETFLDKSNAPKICMEKLGAEKPDCINLGKDYTVANIQSYNRVESEVMENCTKTIIAENSVSLDKINITVSENVLAGNIINKECGLQTLTTKIDYNLNTPACEKISEDVCQSVAPMKDITSGVDMLQESSNKMMNIQLIRNDVIILNSTLENDESDIKTVHKGVQEVLVEKVSNLDISENVQKVPCKSEVIIKNPTDSLKHLLIYDNSTDEDDDDDYDEFQKNLQLHKVQSSSDSESDSTESLDECDTDDTADEISSDTVFTPNTGAIKKDYKKPSSILVDELDFYLPPLLDLSTLKIDYDKEEFLHIGKIKAIIETLVTVEAIPGTPAYDLESVLFINNQTTKCPMGTVYDVIGPVSSPIYCIRFDNKEQMDELCLKLGQNVYSAPKSEYTRYVFVKELLKVRGSDASWVGDKELPPELADISDSEEVDNFEETRKAPKRKHGSLERHQQFEKSMNVCNTLNTRVTHLVDAHHRLSRNKPIQDSLHHHHSGVSIVASPHMMDLSRLLAPFDPTVPPPGFRDNSLDRYRAHGNATRDGSSYGGPHPVWTWTPPELYQNTSYSPGINTQAAAAGGGAGQRNVQGNNNSAHYRTNHAARQAGPSNRPY